MPTFLKNATVDIAAAATTTVVAAKAGFAIGVAGLSLYAGGTVTPTFQDNASSPVALTGPLPMKDQGTYILPLAPYNDGGGGQQQWFQTSADCRLDIVTTGTGQLSGQITYFYIPVSK